MRGIVPEEPLPGCLQIEPSPAPAEMKTCWMRACSSSQVGDGVNPNILRPMPHFSSHASFFDEGTDITCLLCYPGLEIMVFHDLPGELCLLAPFLR